MTKIFSIIPCSENSKVSVKLGSCYPIATKIAYNVCPIYIKLHNKFQINPCKGMLGFLWRKFSLLFHVVKTAKFRQTGSCCPIATKIAYNICPIYINPHVKYQINPWRGSWDFCDKIFGRTDKGIPIYHPLVKWGYNMMLLLGICCKLFWLPSDIKFQHGRKIFSVVLHEIHLYVFF